MMNSGGYAAKLRERYRDDAAYREKRLKYQREWYVRNKKRLLADEGRAERLRKAQAKFKASLEGSS